MEVDIMEFRVYQLVSLKRPLKYIN